MEWMHKLEPVWLALLVVGGLNWACIALFDTNVMSDVLGTGTILDVAYVLVGVAALMSLAPMLERARLGSHHHPHGAH